MKISCEKAGVEYANSQFSNSMNTLLNIYRFYLDLAFVQCGQHRICYHEFGFIIDQIILPKIQGLLRMKFWSHTFNRHWNVTETFFGDGMLLACEVYDMITVCWKHRQVLWSGSGQRVQNNHQNHLEMIFMRHQRNWVLVFKLKFHQNLGGDFSFLTKLFRDFSNY